jgi:hypothetical protein
MSVSRLAAEPWRPAAIYGSDAIVSALEHVYRELPRQRQAKEEYAHVLFGMQTRLRSIICEYGHCSPTASQLPSSVRAHGLCLMRVAGANQPLPSIRGPVDVVKVQAGRSKVPRPTVQDINAVLTNLCTVLNIDKDRSPVLLNLVSVADPTW